VVHNIAADPHATSVVVSDLFDLIAALLRRVLCVSVKVDESKLDKDRRWLSGSNSQHLFCLPPA
jgi:hypothetical protein